MKTKTKSSSWEAALLGQLSKIKFRFIVGQHCFTHTSNRPKKKEKNKNKQQLHRQKKKKENLFIFGLATSYKPRSMVQLKYIHKKSYWNAQNKIVIFFFFHFCLFLIFFFTRFCFILLWDNGLGLVTPQVKSEIGNKRDIHFKAPLLVNPRSLKNGGPPNNMYKNIKCK